MATTMPSVGCLSDDARVSVVGVRAGVGKQGVAASLCRCPGNEAIAGRSPDSGTGMRDVPL